MNAWQERNKGLYERATRVIRRGPRLQTGAPPGKGRQGRKENGMSEDAYRQGLEMKRRLFGAGKERPVSHGHLADDLLRLSDELVFGRVYTRPGLDLKTRSMLTVAALTVLGRDDYLRRHLQGALHVGVTPAEIKEILMQMAFYGGMPVALKALRVAEEEITAWEAARPTAGA
jgi:4-carboxymuconolactone decarboxylase